MATSPIRLGSANGSYLVFESNSDVQTSASGIQSVNVKGLWGDGSTVWSKIPAAGTSFSDVFGHSYLPADFKVDRSKDSSIGVEYLEGRTARLTFNFKRADPAAAGETASRQVFVDSVLNYKSILSNIYLTPISLAATGEPVVDLVGFPEPVVTVKYNTTAPPAIGGGSLATCYALPGSALAQGFPAVADIPFPLTFTIAAGMTVYYLGPGGTYVGPVTLTSNTTFNYVLSFIANPLGWQLTKLKYDPVSGGATYDVEQDWRNFYIFRGSSFVSKSPP